MAEPEKSDPAAAGPQGPDPMLDSNVWQESLPVTVWEVLKEGDERSVEHFARRYATPIYSYFRRRGLKREEAKDLTMDFIVEKFIRGELVKKFKPGPHRFRAYLVRSLKHFLTDHFRKKRRRRTLQLDQIARDQTRFERALHARAEKEFLCGCVHDQIRQAILRVKSECKRDGLEKHFRIFCQRHFADPTPSWAQVGRRFGLSWQEAKNKAWTVRERLKKALLAEFKIQDMTDAQARDEIRELMGLFDGATGRELVSEDTVA